MSFLLAEEGQTAKIRIEDVEFEIKVLTYKQRLEWATENDKKVTWDEMKESLCSVIIGVEGFKTPGEFLDKIIKADDINKIIIALASAAGLNEDSGKNLEDLSELPNTKNTSSAAMGATPASDNVSISDPPSFSKP
jgi:hypothetical protein